MRINKRSAIVATVPLAITAGLAMAYTVVQGTGVGTTTASNNKAQFTTTVSVPQSLDIGTGAPVTIKVKNTGTAAEKVRNLTVSDPAIAAAAGETCDPRSFKVEWGNVALPSAALPPGGPDVQVRTGTLTFVNLEDADQTGCAGAHVTITATASSVPAA